MEDVGFNLVGPFATHGTATRWGEEHLIGNPDWTTIKSGDPRLPVKVFKPEAIERDIPKDYLLVHSDTELHLVGPFCSVKASKTWGTNAMNKDADVEWSPICLSNIKRPITVVEP